MHKLLFGKLWRELLWALLFTMLLTVVFYFAGLRLLDFWLYHYLEGSSFSAEITEISVAQFQKYVTENGISSTDTAGIRKWIQKTEPVSFGIINNNQVQFDYNGIETDGTYGEMELESAMSKYIHEISFADKTVTIYYDGLFDYKIYVALNFLLLLLSLFLFIGTFIRLIRNKISYITRLEAGIHILEGGDLQYEIEVRGYDELAGLARSLNDMRLSLAHQIEAKEEAFQANHSLITALSHDLRTPLTTQTGYLEILKEGHYQTGEEHDRYVDKCLDTCKQIKGMSDRLFDYFFAFRREEPEACGLEVFDAGELFLQFISENTFLLEEDGFCFRIEIPEEKSRIKANVDYLCRIFDNLFSNIKKYAEKAEPILIGVCKSGRWVELSFRNVIRREPVGVESAKVGLENVKNLMKSQGGRAEFFRQKDAFEIKLFFPLCDEKVK